MEEPINVSIGDANKSRHCASAYIFSASIATTNRIISPIDIESLRMTERASIPTLSVREQQLERFASAVPAKSSELLVPPPISIKKGGRMMGLSWLLGSSKGSDSAVDEALIIDESKRLFQSPAPQAPRLSAASIVPLMTVSAPANNTQHHEHILQTFMGASTEPPLMPGTSPPKFGSNNSCSGAHNSSSSVSRATNNFLRLGRFFDASAGKKWVARSDSVLFGEARSSTIRSGAKTRRASDISAVTSALLKSVVPHRRSAFFMGVGSYSKVSPHNAAATTTAAAAAAAAVMTSPVLNHQQRVAGNSSITLLNTSLSAEERYDVLGGICGSNSIASQPQKLSSAKGNTAGPPNISLLRSMKRISTIDGFLNGKNGNNKCNAEAVVYNKDINIITEQAPQISTRGSRRNVFSSHFINYDRSRDREESGGQIDDNYKEVGDDGGRMGVLSREQSSSIDRAMHSSRVVPNSPPSILQSFPSSPVYSSSADPNGSGGMTFFEEIENRRKHIAKLSNIGEQLSFLIVDDCPVSRKVARRLLVNQGQHVMEAIDGLDCIRIYEEVVENGGGKLDVILMDEDMPLMSGKEASYVLRSKGYDNPIIGLSGEIRDYVINSFIDHGANAVLPKPLSIKMLEAELARLG